MSNDGSRIIIQKSGKSKDENTDNRELIAFFKNNKLYAYNSNQAISMVLTFPNPVGFKQEPGKNAVRGDKYGVKAPDGTNTVATYAKTGMGTAVNIDDNDYISMGYEFTWYPDDPTNEYQKVEIDTTKKTIFNKKSNLYLTNFFTSWFGTIGDTIERGNEAHFTFTKSATKAQATGNNNGFTSITVQDTNVYDKNGGSWLFCRGADAPSGCKTYCEKTGVCKVGGAGGTDWKLIFIITVSILGFLLLGMVLYVVFRDCSGGDEQGYMGGMPMGPPMQPPMMMGPPMGGMPMQPY
jgi:hypothetical protein